MQRTAINLWKADTDLRTKLDADPEPHAALSDADLDDCSGLAHHTQHVDTIFARAVCDG